MKLFKTLIPAVLFLLLNACGSKELIRMGFEKVESFRTELAGLGFADGTATVSLYNGNKKIVIFDRGRIELKLNGRTLGAVTLRESIQVKPGFGKTEIPVYIRFSQDGLKAAMELIFPARETRGRKPNWRVSGSLTFVAGNNRPLRQRTVRFDRRLNRDLTELLYNCFPN